jgi:type II secretory pathway predicted ATPase ExeA
MNSFMIGPPELTCADIMTRWEGFVAGEAVAGSVGDGGAEAARSSAGGEIGYRPGGDARGEAGRLVTGSASSAGFDFVDPFGVSADPARYVPRVATERALERLLRAVLDERRSAVVGGIPGIGKTLLLRLLARRLAPELRTVHLPYASIPAAALCAWAMDLLGGGSSYDPVGAVVAHARRLHADGAGLVLLIDDAEAMPEGAAPQLARAAGESGGALRLVAAVAEAAAGRLVDAWDDAERVALLEPMGLDETSRYLAAHLEAAGLPETARAAFDASTLSELQRRSGGVPGRVNAEASILLRRILAREQEERARAEEHEAAFERAAGRLALAHSELASEDAGEEAAPVFERAAGRLAIARLEDEPQVEGEPLEAELSPEAERPPAGAGAEPAAASARPEATLPAPTMAEPGAEDLGAAPTPRLRRGPAWGGWLIVFGAFFAIGGGVGIWLVPRWLAESETQPPAPLAAEAVPAVPSAAEEAAPAAEVGEEAMAAASPAPPAATLSVQINANPWATILVDGEEVGITPLAGVPVAAGLHSFEARFPDGRVVERVVEIDQMNRFVVFP